MHCQCFSPYSFQRCFNLCFELDPLLEDKSCTLSVAEKAKQYVELGKQWAAGHDNRMIKVPATPAGLDALEDLAAADITLNVTLIFSTRQYHAAREAVWRGAQRRGDLKSFKSVYSIFVSRLDVYSEKHVPELSAAAQGQVGIVNAKRLSAHNRLALTIPTWPCAAAESSGTCFSE